MILSFHTSIADELPKVKADFSFFLLMAMLFLMRDVRTASGIVIVCGLHELGHLAVMAVFRAKVRSIHFSGTGIRITAEKSGTEPLLQSVLILLSGPAVNIILYFLLREKVPDTAYLSLGAGLYNLLPYSQLDGGAVLEVLILGSGHEYAYRMAVRLIRLALTALSAVMVYCCGSEYLPAFAALLLLYLNDAAQHRKFDV
ncbi:MAG: hypothetical protein J5926_06610 [Ruminococcus sp.]|nr:hypothetical protein [Ruminococcus sp.]